MTKPLTAEDRIFIPPGVHSQFDHDELQSFWIDGRNNTRLAHELDELYVAEYKEQFPSWYQSPYGKRAADAVLLHKQEPMSASIVFS